MTSLHADLSLLIVYSNWWNKFRGLSVDCDDMLEVVGGSAAVVNTLKLVATDNKGYDNVHIYMCSHTHTHTHTHTDKIKDAVIAKIAMQASDLYANAYSNMLVGSVKQQWDKV